MAQEHWHFGVGEQDKERVFRRVAAMLHEVREPLTWGMIQEGGKLWRWAEAEVQEAIDTVWHYHGEISRMYGRVSRCQMPDKLSITLREPYGVAQRRRLAGLEDALDRAGEGIPIRLRLPQFAGWRSSWPEEARVLEGKLEPSERDEEA